MHLIELEEVSYLYPGAASPALSRISLAVDEGEYVAVVGANGSGKSSLLRLLDGLRTPTEGEVRVASVSTSREEGRRAALREVGLVFQFPADQIVSSSVEEDVAFGPECLGLPREEIRRRVDSALAAVGLEAAKGRPSHFLSAGQQQRLAVAGVLATSPRCVAFDEATAMLDPAARRSVLGLMDALVASGVAVVHVTQDMSEAARARRVLVLDSGRLVFDGSPAELFASGSPRVGALAAIGLPDWGTLAAMLGLEMLPLESPDGLAARIAAAYPAPRAGPGPRGDSVRPARVGPRPREPGADGRGSPAGALAFELRGASHSYLAGTANEVRSLSGIDLAIPAGKLVAFVGRTGSGKSTALQLLDGLVAPTSGKVASLGVDLGGRSVDLKKVRTSAPLAVQRPESALFETYAADDVAFGPRNLGLSGKALVARVSSSMEEAGLGYEVFRDRRTRSLSGGERRRLALAGVLAMGGEALLLDEPTSSLDPATRRQVMDLVGRKAKEGVTVVVATHSMDEAAAADFVAVFSGGSLAALGNPEEVFYDLYDPAWEIGRPFAVEVAIALEDRGFHLGSRPLDLRGLAAAVGASRRGAPPETAAGRPSAGGAEDAGRLR